MNKTINGSTLYQTNKDFLKLKSRNDKIFFCNNNVKLNKLRTDMISFGNINPVETAERKIVDYVKALLKDLTPDQSVKISVTKENIPVAKLLAREAYKMGSGNVYVDVIEPELDQLKQKYDGKDFQWKALKKQTLKEQNALFINLNSSALPYEKARLTTKELTAINNHYTENIPKDVIKLMEKFVFPKEIIDGKLNLRKGQPIRIFAERQHEPLVLKLAEYAYQKGASIVDVVYNEGGPNDFDRTYTELASEKAVMKIPEWLVPQYQEFIDTQTARLYLDGENPKALEGVDSDRMELTSKGTVARNKAIEFYRKDNSCPWCIYYAPTTKSSIVAYPEVIKGSTATPEEEIEALRKAAIDAYKINRVGTAQAHYANLKRISDKINNLKLDKVHFVRRDKETGKLLTDLYISMGPKSIFRSAEEKTIPNKKGEQPQNYIANCPTEEVFTTPDNRKVSGFVTATLPLSLEGKIIEDIYVEFDDTGKIILDKVNASKNKDVFVTHIKNNEGADRLGEVALVAGSPIFETGRLFYNTLLDENAACHIAIGEGFAECIEGAAEQDPDKKDAYLKANHCNESTTHVDFMIGGPDVLVEGIKTQKDGSITQIPLIENNQFKI